MGILIFDFIYEHSFLSFLIYMGCAFIYRSIFFEEMNGHYCRSRISNELYSTKEARGMSILFPLDIIGNILILIGVL